jgi:hypothetical protein
MTPLRVIIRIEAETDITDAAIYYERQTAALGQQFFQSIDQFGRAATSSCATT